MKTRKLINETLMLMAEVSKIGHKNKITKNELFFLGQVYDGISMKDIVDYSCLVLNQTLPKDRTRITCSQTSKALVEKGFIWKEKTDKDKRTTLLYLTKKGKELIEG